MGQPPERIEVNPRQSSFLATGTWETNGHSVAINLQATPMRIDWRLESGAGLDIRSEGLVTAGSATRLIPAFRDLMVRWLSECPGLERIAFGAVLLLPTDSLVQGYQILSAYLPFQLDLSDSSDFSFQINRRRRSSALEIELNRLSKWSVAVIETQAVEFSGGVARAVAGSRHFAVRMELDINTSPEFRGELPSESLPSIFGELVDVAMEIAQEGLAEEYGKPD